MKEVIDILHDLMDKTFRINFENQRGNTTEIKKLTNEMLQEIQDILYKI